jgi:hypothetical protein
MQQSLFPSRPQGSAQGNVLLSFKAGKCNFSAATPLPSGKFLVSADPRRGTIALVQNNRDGLTHFQWIDRSNGRVEEDRIVFPGDVVFKKIDTGRPTDRVYVMKLSQMNTNHLFWLQDKDDSKDADNCKKFNETVNGGVGNTTRLLCYPCF